MNNSFARRRLSLVVWAVLFLILLFSTTPAQEKIASRNDSSKQTAKASEQIQPTADANSDDSQAGNQDPQTPNNNPPTNPPAKKKNNPIQATKTLVKDVLHDQKEIWLSPLKIQARDCRWLIPLAAATATLIGTDQHLTRKIGGGEDQAEASSVLSRFGTGYVDFGVAGSFYVIGKFTHSERATETGALAIQALINSSIVVTGLKYATERQRPNASDGDGHFFERGSSFPSGHAVTVWALATVIAEEYKDKPLVRIAAYGIASAVSVARVSGRSHFASDAFVGSTLGYLIGHYTVKHYGKHQGGRLAPTISPYVSPKTRTYGLAAGLSF